MDYGPRALALTGRDVLTHLAVDLGFGTFVLATPPDPDTLTTFIEDVAPKVRERVAQQRADGRA